MKKKDLSAMKKDLLEIGKWSDFIRLKEEKYGNEEKNYEYKALYEISPKIARKYFPNIKYLISDEGNAVDMSSVANMAALGLMDGDGESGKEAAGGEGKKARRSGKRLLSSSVFSGKKCSMTEAITWAYINSSLGDPKPKDAPSALAWKLLCDFRNSLDYAQDLFKGIAVSKAKKEDLEDSNRSALSFDGMAEYNICARLGGYGECHEVEEKRR